MSPERPGRWVTRRPGAGKTKWQVQLGLEEPLAGKASGAGFVWGRPAPSSVAFRCLLPGMLGAARAVLGREKRGPG